MMNAVNSVRRTVSVRRAACQRCGWTQQVVRTHGHGSAHRGRCGYRWVCSDCLADLGSDSTTASHPQRTGLVSAA